MENEKGILIHSFQFTEIDAHKPHRVLKIDGEVQAFTMDDCMIHDTFKEEVLRTVHHCIAGKHVFVAVGSELDNLLNVHISSFNTVLQERDRLLTDKSVLSSSNQSLRNDIVALEIIERKYDKIKAMKFFDRLKFLLTGKLKGVVPFKFEVGGAYETQEGVEVVVLSRTRLVGYECLMCSDGVCRYDRSTHNSDAGRVTGTNHDYSDPRNFIRYWEKKTIHF